MLNFRLRLRDRILLGYGVPLILTLASTSVVILNAKKVEQQSREVSRGWLLVQQSDRLELLLHKRQAMARTYFLTQNQKFWQDYEESVVGYNQLMAQLEQIIQYSSPEQKQRLGELKQLGKAIYQANTEVHDLIQAGQSTLAIQRFSQGKVIPLVDQASATFQALNDTEDQLQTARETEGQNAMKWLVLTAMIGTLSAIALAIAIGSWLASRMTQEVNQIANNIAGSSTEIAATVEQQERVSAQQATAANETSVTMDELGVSARRSAEQAEAAAASAYQALTMVGGNDQNSFSAGSSSNLRGKVNQIAEQVARLSDQTSQIGVISNLVSDLANQTNMLALNAAVEAVRAGEHGKGFGVVATEIRKLAEQSRLSAERITGLVVDIQSSTNSTVMVTDEGTKTVENIIAAINNISINSQQISLTAKEQAIAIQQVVSAINSLNQGAAQTASGISQTKVSTHELNEAARQLKAVV